MTTISRRRMALRYTKKYRHLIRAWYRTGLQLTHLFAKIPLPENQKLFGLAVFIGVFCGIVTVAFHHFIILAEDGLIQTGIANAKGWKNLWVLLIPALGGLLSGILMLWMPEVRGSGIPNVKVAYYLRSGRIPLKTII